MANRAKIDIFKRYVQIPDNADTKIAQKVLLCLLKWPPVPKIEYHFLTSSSLDPLTQI